MFFKVYIKQVKDGKFIGEAALTGDYRNLKTAINAGKENLLTDESTFCVRKYDDTVAVNIMSNNINDTGNLVYVCKNYLEVARDKDNTNKAQEDRKPVHVVFGKIQEETVRRQLKAMRIAVEAGTLTMPAVVSVIMDTFADKDSKTMRAAFIDALPDDFKREIKEDVEMENIREDVENYCTELQLPCTDELAGKVAERWVKARDYDCNADYWSNIETLINKESEKLELSKETEDIELD